MSTMLYVEERVQLGRRIRDGSRRDNSETTPTDTQHLARQGKVSIYGRVRRKSEEVRDLSEGLKKKEG